MEAGSPISRSGRVDSYRGFSPWFEVTCFLPGLKSPACSLALTRPFLGMCRERESKLSGDSSYKTLIPLDQGPILMISSNSG
jgi:hypothetical protein